MKRHLDRLVARDESRQRDDAAVAWGQTWALPDLAEEILLRVLFKCRRHRPDIVERQRLSACRWPRSALGLRKERESQAERYDRCGDQLHRCRSSVMIAAGEARLLGIQ